jgi:AraC-like DNA-binding protein
MSVAMKNADDACEAAISRLRALPLRMASVFFPDRRFPLHAMLSSGGHSIETTPDYRWDGMTRGKASFAVLQLTLHGSGRLETRTRRYELTRRSLMLVNVPGAHTYFLPDDSVEWEFVYLVVYGRELLRIILGAVKRAGNVFVLTEDSGIPDAFHRVLEALYLPQPLTPFEISSLVYSLCMRVLVESYWPPAARDASRFDTLKAYLRENIERDIPVAEMAGRVGLSRSHFTRLFKEVEGLPPRDFVEDLRLKQAVQLLYSEKLTVKEIAYACGIPDVNYFCRLFRKHMGMSPGEYRKSGF